LCYRQQYDRSVVGTHLQAAASISQASAAARAPGAADDLRRPALPSLRFRTAM
jgi:hypothetical protein